MCYENGVGVPVDARKAVEYYTESGERGQSSAFVRLGKPFFNFDLNLGFCYKFGIGVAADSKKAFQMFNEAHKIGGTIGTYNMALCYKDGVGVPKNPESALGFSKFSSLMMTFSFVS